jgi:hypothetical protein
MRMFVRHLSFALGVATLFAATSAFAQKSDGVWPRVIQNAMATVTVYQPQIESFNDIMLDARAAVSVKPPQKEPIFGAVWFHARTTVDKQARTVTLDSTLVTNMKFPNATPEQEAWLKSVIDAEIPNWGHTISYDVLVSQLENVSQEQAASAKLNNAPPAIIYVTAPTVLIMIDGEPKYKDAEGGLKVVGNTPFFIVQDTASKVWYLKGREAWYSGPDVLGPWSAMSGSQPPQSVQTLAAKNVSAPPDSLPEEKTPTIPAVIVRTKPAEIVQTDGEPKLEPVKGTNLLYVKNSEDTIIMDIDSQQYYVLLAGRFYTTKSLSGGPWTYVPGDQLPKDFAKIPGDSDLADALTSVPGTTEAKEAVLENSIPQTAKVDRKTADLKVTYDGQPKFEAITGTSMSYAVNTDKSVLLISNRYYCCDQAIWFESNSANGPWVVSTKVPDEVQSIPPDCPVYNVKYVYIYEATPEVVYEGYTPAYTGSYVYNGCVVYGTGYYYNPWYSPYYYYPRPVTYGFAVHYNPWTGWGFSVGISYGWMNISVGHYGGYWGPGGYGYGYRHGYGHGYHHGYNNGYRHGFGAGYVAGKNQGNRPTQYSRNNYQNRQGVKSTPRPSTQPANGSRARASQQPNNVYADRNGDVYRNNNGNWQSRDAKGNGWQNTGNTSRPSAGQQPAQRPSQQPSVSQQPRPSTNDLNKQYQARERSNQRSQSYQRSSGGGGRSRGGGGGRRR